MWGVFFVIVVAIGFVLWALFVIPDDRRHHRQQLEIIRKKLARLEQRKQESGSADQGPDDEDRPE